MVSNLGPDRAPIHYYKTHQNTDRIARITSKVLICRAFLRSVFLWVMDCQGTVTDRVSNTDRLLPARLS